MRSAFVAMLAGAVPVVAGADEEFPPVPQASTVVSVYDGDTFTLVTGDKVRVSGVNTPELRPLEAYGIEARDFTTSFVGDNEVELVYGSAGHRDSYGRLLAYVRVDGKPLEEALVEQGFGHVFLIPPVEVVDMDRILAAQGRARKAGLGIWSGEGFQGEFHITSFHANGQGIDEQHVNGEYLRICNITEKPVDIGGFALFNAAGERYELPSLVVPAGHTVKVFSGRGRLQADPAKQLEIYLASATPIWNNGYDKVVMLDPRGVEVDHREHKVKKPTR